MASQPTYGMLNRMLRACRLDIHLFEEVEAAPSATKQALTVVVLVSLATGIASLGTTGIGGLFAGVIVGIAGWGVWAWIVHFIGTRILSVESTHANWGQLARTLGFAQSPGILRVFGVVPGIGLIIVLVVSVWMLVTMVIAVRQALDFSSTGRAVGVVLLSFIPYLIFMSIAYAVLGG